MKRFLKLVLIEWKLNSRNFLNVFFALVFPVMMLMLFGTMYGNEPSEFMGGKGFIDVTIPGYVCMIIGVTGLMTLPLTLSQYREKKILKRFRITPIKPFELLCSQLIVNTITTLVGMTLLVIIAKIVFDLKFIGHVLDVSAAFILVLLSIFSIGLLIAGISKNTKSAMAVSYIIYFPMLFLSGATMPLELMPNSILNISKFLPLTYGVRLLSGVWMAEPMLDYIYEIIVLLVITSVFGGLAIKFFKWA